MMRLVAVVVVGVIGATPARADTPMQEARTLVTSADRDYKLGRFAEALAEYTKAYERYPVAGLLFNIAQCHRNLKQWERAVFFYEGFLRDAKPDDPNRSVVADLLRESREALAREQAADAEQQKRAADDAAARQRADDDARRAAEAQREADSRRRADEDRRLALARQQGDEPPIYKKWWFWSAVGGVAVAAGLTGYYFSGSTTFVQPSGSLGGLDRR